MKRVILIAILIVALSACAPKPEKLQPLVEQTLTAIPTNTAYPTYTPYPTYTLYPTNTIVAATQTPSAATTPENMAISKNHIHTYETKGVSVELYRVLICDKNWRDVKNYADYKEWNNANSYLMIEFKVINSGDKKISTMLLQGCQVAINQEEQIDCYDYFWNMRWVGDNLDRDTLPGVTRRGTYYLPLKTNFEDVRSVYLSFPGVFINQTGVLNNLDITLDVTDWAFEDRPVE